MRKRCVRARFIILETQPLIYRGAAPPLWLRSAGVRRFLFAALEGIRAHGQGAQASSTKRHQLENPPPADAALVPDIDGLLPGLRSCGLLANCLVEFLFPVRGSRRRATGMPHE